MRMVCPACSAAYEVPESLLAPGRVARCARCGNEWVPVATEPAAPPPETSPQPRSSETEAMEQVEAEPPAPTPAPAPAPADIPRFTAMDRLALNQATTRDRTVPLRLAWVATILALLALGAVAYVWRVELMHVWPPSQRLYDALGLLRHAPVPGKP